ncbi:MAG: type II CAAX endopeptidase family protein [Woeseiaceae bacterium]|nr:type II CAAX endopeptidase family protein [Woeseiaceae bacterium]
MASRARSILVTTGKLALFILVFAAMSSITLLPQFLLFDDWADGSPRLAQLAADLGGAVAILAATWIMLRFVDRRPFVSIGFKPGNARRDVAFGVLIGCAWLAVSIGFALLAGWARPRDPVGISVALLALAAVSTLLNVLTQQLMLCGYILQTLRDSAGTVAAVILAAGLFALLHIGGFDGAWLPPVNVFLAGLLFCLAYLATSNLWLPIGIHFGWNFLLGPVAGLTVSGTGQLGLGWQLFELEGPALMTGGEFGLEGGLVVTTMTAAVIAAIYAAIRKPPAEPAPEP